MIQKLKARKNYSVYLAIGILALISILAFLYYYSTGQNLLYADAISRLNIARKVVDNLTPGLPQLGNVWLPLPQLLMLPLIWNEFLWHSGIAGAVMSMSCYILGGYFIFKSAKIISNSNLGSFLALSIYALNINILYLQTTAMSESLFLCTLSATIYYFLRFFKSYRNIDLIPAALSVCAMTLTRYEGLAILLSSIPMVYVFTLIKHRKHSKAEANTILYAALACLGFVLWTIYLTAIFGDPLYWKNYYATEQATGTGEKVFTQAKPFIAAVWQYATSMLWMVGIIPGILAGISIVIMLIKSIREKTLTFIPLLLPLAIFLFMVLTLQRNTPIVQPALNFENILSSETSSQTGFNIRYGLLMLPWIAILTAYLFTFKNIFIKSVIAVSFVLAFSIQILSYGNSKYSVVYQIPASLYDKPYASLVDWMKENYDGGFILISASSHEDQMFQMGFDYKTYIHEGNYKYWKESLDNPPRYATWVVIDKGHHQDMVARKNGIEKILDRDYNLMYNKEGAKVYRIKNKPYFEIKT